MAEYKPIVSSNLDAASYEPTTRELIVKFKNGTAYKYPDVPVKIYVDFEKTFSGEGDKSAGKYFNGHIRHLPSEKIEVE